MTKDDLIKRIQSTVSLLQHAGATVSEVALYKSLAKAHLRTVDKSNWDTLLKCLEELADPRQSLEAKLFASRTLYDITHRAAVATPASVSVSMNKKKRGRISGKR